MEDLDKLRLFSNMAEDMDVSLMTMVEVVWPIGGRSGFSSYKLVELPFNFL